MIKIYTDSFFLTPQNRSFVFPLLFDLCYTHNIKTKEKFILVDSLTEADLVLFPLDIAHFYNIKKRQFLIDFITLANVYQKPVWVYSGGDFGISLEEHVTTFRLGGFHSKLNGKTQILPSFVNDPYLSILEQEWKALGKSVLPTIGFVGNATSGIQKQLKELLIYSKQTLNRIIKKDFSDHQTFFPSSIIRFRLLRKIEANAGIKSDFIYRKEYRAGANSTLEREKTHLAFLKNIETNLYTFCIRGAGNFSVRFYETLIMGRIPLLIDTDCRLPLADSIEWSKHCVIANISNYEEKLINFHNSKNEKELIEIQIANRKLALEKLNRVDFFIDIVSDLFLK